MVQVNLDLLFPHFEDATVEALSFFVLQGDDGILVDVLMVELSVDGEDVACQIQHVVVVVFTISLFLAECEVELLSLWCLDDDFLELVECKTKAADETKGLSLLGFLHQVRAVFVGGVELVCHRHVFVLFFFHK